MPLYRLALTYASQSNRGEQGMPDTESFMHETIPSINHIKQFNLIDPPFERMPRQETGHDTLD